MIIITEKTLKAICAVLAAAVVAGAAGCARTAARTEGPKNAPVAAKPSRPTNESPTPRTSPTPVVNENGDPSTNDGDLEFYQRERAGQRERDVSPAKPGDRNKVTKANFNRIQLDMKLADVKRILGDDGRRIGMKNVNGEISETYKWYIDGEDAWIEVTVKENTVIAKNGRNLP